MRIAATLALLSAGLGLGACGTLPDVESFRAPDTTSLFRPLSVTGFKEKPLAPVTAEDLVDAGGRCAGTFAAAGADPTIGATGGGQAGAEPQTLASARPTDADAASVQGAGALGIPAAVALGMTECDVVRRIGLADKVEIGRNERGERTATLTYLRGSRPGIYFFADGRLKSLERAPEPPPQPKPVKRSPRTKRAATR